eukprot:11179891-Lingulodinium_polyedra.AAC.1
MCRPSTARSAVTCSPSYFLWVPVLLLVGPQPEVGARTTHGQQRKRRTSMMQPNTQDRFKMQPTRNTAKR